MRSANGLKSIVAPLKITQSSQFQADLLNWDKREKQGSVGWCQEVGQLEHLAFVQEANAHETCGISVFDPGGHEQEK